LFFLRRHQYFFTSSKNLARAQPLTRYAFQSCGLAAIARFASSTCRSKSACEGGLPVCEDTLLARIFFHLSAAPLFPVVALFDGLMRYLRSSSIPQRAFCLFDCASDEDVPDLREGYVVIQRGKTAEEATSIPQKPLLHGPSIASAPKYANSLITLPSHPLSV
jgi:hypothetical protein